MKTLTENERLIIEAAAAIDPKFAKKYKTALTGTNQSPVISYWFVINGQEVGKPPVIAAGAQVLTIVWIQNNDIVLRDVGIKISQHTTGTVLIDTGDYPYEIISQTASHFALQMFTMPNSQEYLDIILTLDGVAYPPAQWPINLLSSTQPLTSVDLTVPGLAVNGRSTPFTGLVTNVSAQTISVQMTGTLNPSTNNINVPITPASFSLAPGKTQSISGSFIMPSEIYSQLVVKSFINGQEDTFYTAYIQEEQASTPKLLINDSQIAEDGSLVFSGSGFASATMITLYVIDAQGNSTNVEELGTDESGNFNGTTPGLQFIAGNYTLQAVDVTGNTATAAFSIIAPATLSTRVSPSNSGTIVNSPAASFKSGMEVTFTATAKSGYYFSYWLFADGTTSTNNPSTWALLAGKNIVTAIFNPTNITQPAALTTPVSPSGGGTVIITPGAPWSVGDTVVVTAVPASGYYFDHWLYGGISITDNPHQIVLAASNSISAVFTTTAPNPPPANKSWWSKLSKTEQNLIIGGGAVVLVGGIVTLIVTTGKKSK